MNEPNELLIIFQQLILKYGGRQKLIYSLEIEWMKPITGEANFKWTHEKVDYIIQGYHKLSVARMAQVLKCSIHVIDRKLRELRATTDLLGHGRKRHIHLDT